MIAGRLRAGTGATLVVGVNASELFDWKILDDAVVPANVREAVLAALDQSTDSAFCEALPLIEGFLRDAPNFLSERGPAIHVHASTQFDSPVMPRNFICVGLNYRDHAQETGLKIPEKPLLFAKTWNAINGHNCPVFKPEGTAQVDYEAEVTVVIGRKCHRVSPADALSYVAGYTCGNDVSARDFQFGDGQWFRGKSIDGFGPIGPWIVTPSAVGDPHKLRIRLRLNGQTMQDSTTANLIFGIPELVSFTSRNMTLMPGDVIMTGTPPGVGFTRKPPVFVKPGDRMEVEIENVGTLANTIAPIQT
jgi:2-keto-4-pentenoate hydratase/2-oxohepta-3-ene-1,7-dioic acid hydratase in catechol pathway